MPTLSYFIFWFSFVVLGIEPSSLCEKPSDFNLWNLSSQQEFNEVCSLAGVYENSLVPDSEALKGKSPRDGAPVIYDYESFSKSLTSSLNRLTKPELCESQDSTARRVSYPTVTLEPTATGSAPVSVISEAELAQIYKEFAEDPNYVFEVPEEGCWARAALMTKALESKGIRAAKVFAEGPFWYPDTDEQSPPRRWAYHVAPVVGVQTARGVEFMVLDPSTFKKPVSAKEWGTKFFSMAEEKESAKVYFTDRFSLAPLYGDSPSENQKDSAQGRWHKAELLMAEQELKRLRQNQEESW